MTELYLIPSNIHHTRPYFYACIIISIYRSCKSRVSKNKSDLIFLKTFPISIRLTVETTMQSTTQISKITILSSNNGYKWLQDITSSFYRNNIINIVSGVEPKPAENQDAWIQKDNLAKSIIHGAVSSDFRSFFD